MTIEKKMENSIGKKIKVYYKDGKVEKLYCTEYVEKVLEDEEPMIFCDPDLAIALSDIEDIEILD